jgi:hypothetical protein
MLYTPNQPVPPQLRTRCRNPRCGTALKVPAANPRDAFCCKGCERAFYRSRCRVCEQLFSRKNERRIVCGREKCRYEFKRYSEQFYGVRYPSSPIAHNASRSAHFTGLKSGTKSDRGSRVIGPEDLRVPPKLPASKPDRAFREYIKRESAKAVFQRDVPPLNVIGGYRFPGGPRIDLNPPPEPPEASARPPIGDGLEIPSFCLMTGHRTGVHTAAELRRSTRRLNRRLSNVDQVLAAMKKGEELHLQYENGRAIWSLSGGRNVAAHVAALIMNNPSIAPAGDSLFPDSPSQTWRYTSND